MSAIFISHSSVDNATASEVAARLEQMGHRSLFLDFDPALGIAAGKKWEQELYARLRSCQAVIALCSGASLASAWCFAEITHARAQGKPLFPLKIDDAEVTPLLRDLQVIDLRADRAQAWQRLAAGLVSAGLDPLRLFHWDGSRPPYPGLLAFQKEDAAVYFGREPAVLATLEALNRLQRLAGARMLVVLGASGSGKSSLVRAGVAPRLARDPARWIVVDPFRPLGRPFEMLAASLAALDAGSDVASWRALLGRSDVDAAWNEIVDRLRRRSARPQASLLVVVDQFEELLVPVADAQSDAFLRMLKAISARATAPVVILATLRSDFLGAFQTHAALQPRNDEVPASPAAQPLDYEALPLPQIALADLTQVIEGPARVAGIELESGLSAAMAADTVTDDALPLLAFALREMWDRFGGSGTFKLADYAERLGGLQGALARAAEALCNERVLPPAQLAQLRAALIRLVRIDAEGRFVRQPRRWDEMAAAVQPLLERFIEARLLVARDEGGQRVVEVAHEALFRAWDRFVVWLNADREFLLWRERLRNAQAEWQRNAQDASLLLRGPLLLEAQKWDKERGDEIDASMRAFIAASFAASEERRAERRQQRQRLIWAAAGVAVVIATIGVLAVWQWQQSGQQRRLALARERSAEAAQTDDILRRVDLTLQSLAQAWTPDAHETLFADLAQIARPVESAWKPHPGPVLAMALSPDGRWLATADQGHLQVQSQGAEPRDLGRGSNHNRIQALAFSDDGRWLAAACLGAKVCVYDTATWALAKDWPHDGLVSTLAFSHDGKWLASASFQAKKTVHLYAVPGWVERAKIETDVPLIWSVAFHPDNRRLAVLGQGLELWQIDGPRPAKLFHQETGSCWRTDFSPDGRHLAACGVSRIVDELGPAALNQPFPIKVRDGPACGGFSRDGARLAVCAESGTGIQIWPQDVASLSMVATTRSATAGTFADGHRLLSGGSDGKVIAWDPDAVAARAIHHAAPVAAIALSNDSHWLATASGPGVLRLFDTRDGSERPALQLEGKIAELVFSVDGRWLAAWAERSLWLIDVNDWRVGAPIVHDATILRAVFDPTSRHVATITQWDKHVTWIERSNGSRQLRVYDIASRAEQASAFMLARDARSGNFQLEAPKRIDDDVAADARSITHGDAALAESSIAWFVRAGERAPSVPWLQGTTPKGEPLYRLFADVANRGVVWTDHPVPVAFGGDGRLMASSDGNDVRLWLLRAEDLRADACARLMRGANCAPQ